MKSRLSQAGVLTSRFFQSRSHLRPNDTHQPRDFTTHLGSTPTTTDFYHRHRQLPKVTRTTPVRREITVGDRGPETGTLTGVRRGPPTTTGPVGRPRPGTTDSPVGSSGRSLSFRCYEDLDSGSYLLPPVSSVIQGEIGVEKETEDLEEEWLEEWLPTKEMWLLQSCGESVDEVRREL